MPKMIKSDKYYVSLNEKTINENDSIELFPELFSGLNDNQKEAVKSTGGYVRIIAGAGSGKTKTLANRYAYIVKALGISPSNILCVTFTNKAAQEMKHRVRLLLNSGAINDLICTYHGFCVKVLREDIHKLHILRDLRYLTRRIRKAFYLKFMKNWG